MAANSESTGLKKRDGGEFTYAEIELFVRKLGEERARLPDPVPTARQPLLVDSSCTWCARSRRYRNTLAERKGGSFS